MLKFIALRLLSAIPVLIGVSLAMHRAQRRLAAESELGKADLSRLGAAGHSAGGGAVARFSRPNLRVRIPMAAGGVTASADLRDTLVLGADEDTVVPPARQRDGYASSPKPKRLAMLAKAGHLAFSDICEAAKDQGGLFNVAKEAGIFVPDLLVRLGSDGCKPEQLAPETLAKVRTALRGQPREAAEASLRTLQQQGLIGDFQLPDRASFPRFDFLLDINVAR